MLLLVAHGDTLIIRVLITTHVIVPRDLPRVAYVALDLSMHLGVILPIEVGLPQTVFEVEGVTFVTHEVLPATAR